MRWLFLLPALSLFCSEPELIQRRVNAHLLIHDTHSAVEEAKQALLNFPDSKQIQLAFIRALCQQGSETEAWEQWKRLSLQFEGEKENRRLLEELAWGVLNKGENSSQIGIRINSLLGAAFTHDAKAIPLLLKQLRGSNALVRSVAVKLAASYGDAVLKDEMRRLLKQEQVWYVRLDVINTVGQMRIKELKKELQEIIGHPKTLAEEKGAALIALVNMYESVDREELSTLAHSARAGLRQLAAEVITHLSLYEHLDLLLPLLKDSSPDVRVSALNSLNLLRVEKIGSVEATTLLAAALKDSAPEVAITAAYGLLLQEDKRGEEAMRTWLHAENPEWMRLSSAALAASGAYGISLAEKEVGTHEDSYVRANLALGLIGQRLQVEKACEMLFELFFAKEPSLWMWDAQYNPLFRSLAPSRLKHIEQIPHYPMVVDQLVRLDILSVLSMLRFSKAQEAVKGFLQTNSWGVTGAASATLLQEGDEECLSAVRALLDDKDEKIRVQAALILAIVGSDPAAVHVLQEAYLRVDREMKVHILEALAHIGAPESIPFLLNILKEPFQTLRVVAASALIQCLYH